MPSLDYAADWKLEEQGRYLYFDGDIEKGEKDKSIYRLIKLVANDLVVLLIQNEQTDAASAAMDINAGSIHDPVELQGLAHFIEHLAFMGTTKFPKENEFDTYLTAHSGYNNANTGTDNTNYYFEVGHEFLEGALDRFAQFFISPLLSEDVILREAEAVDSEYKKHAQKDEWRIAQLQKSLCNPNHPYSQFDIGTIESLVKVPRENGLNIHEEAEKFFKTYYSANIMKLSILGRESLDKLADWAVEYFSDIPNTNVELPTFSDRPPFTEEQLKKQVFVKPVEDGSSLRLVFPFPDQRPVNTKKPFKYIIHLLDHEGPGSIQSFLKRKGWANYISSSVTYIGPAHSVLTVYVDLSKEGAQQYQKVIGVFFNYIQLMKENGIQEELFNDIQSMSSTIFRYQDNGSASDTTAFYSKLLKFDYPPHRVLSGSLIPLEYDPELIYEHLGAIRTDNFSLFLACDNPPNGISFMECERWFGAEYNVLDFDESFIQYLNNLEKEDGLSLPVPNAYIPNNFDVIKQEVTEPKKKPDLIEDSSYLRHWHKKDDTFWAPRANYWMLLRTPLAYCSAANNVKTRLYIDLIDDALMEAIYDARSAGLYYIMEAHPEGVFIFLGGYNQTLPLFVEKLMHQIRHLQVDPDRFNLVKSRAREGLTNFTNEEPSEQASVFLTYLTGRTVWTDLDRLREIDQITAQDMQDFYPTLLSKFHLESLAHGNVTRQESLDTIHHVLEILNPDDYIPVDALPREQSLDLHAGERVIYKRPGEDPNNVNSAIDYLIEICKITDAPLRNKLKLLRQMVHERFFNQLRTNEQLGYSVSCLYYEESGSMGLDFCVQSERDAAYLENRVNAFVQSIREYLQEMDQETYDNHVQSLISKRVKKPNNMGEEGQAYWNEIMGGYYDFEQARIDVEHLRQITKEDMVAFFEEYVDLKSPKTRKLSIHIQAHKKSKADVDMLYQYLVGAEVPDVTLEDLSTAIGDTATFDDTVQENLRQYLNEKCGGDSALVEQLMTTIIETVNSLNQEQNVDELAVGEEESDTFPNEFITDLEDFKSKLILNPPARPVTELVVCNDL